jgi:hypothetical protein
LQSAQICPPFNYGTKQIKIIRKNKKKLSVIIDKNNLVLENQLFAPALKGVIDFFRTL